jgi:hypothetical protein
MGAKAWLQEHITALARPGSDPGSHGAELR